jgi:hypothetical protein
MTTSCPVLRCIVRPLPLLLAVRSDVLPCAVAARLWPTDRLSPILYMVVGVDSRQQLVLVVAQIIIWITTRYERAALQAAPTGHTHTQFGAGDSFRQAHSGDVPTTLPTPDAYRRQLFCLPG